MSVDLTEDILRASRYLFNESSDVVTVRSLMKNLDGMVSVEELEELDVVFNNLMSARESRKWCRELSTFTPIYTTPLDWIRIDDPNNNRITWYKRTIHPTHTSFEQLIDSYYIIKIVIKASIIYDACSSLRVVIHDKDYEFICHREVTDLIKKGLGCGNLLDNHIPFPFSQLSVNFSQFVKIINAIRELYKSKIAELKLTPSTNVEL
jgi:hypothetical protein